MEEILASIRRIIADEDPAKDFSAERPTKPAEPGGLAPAPVASLPASVPPSPATPGEPELSPAEEIDLILAQLRATASRRAIASVEQGETDILALTEQTGEQEDMQPPQEPIPELPSAFHAVPAEPVVPLKESLPEPPTSPSAVAKLQRTAVAPERGLISPATSVAVDSAFNTLAQTVQVQNGRTLEDLVREILRPMLKTWLDDNLPSMVERLVRAEIERVSRGRG